MGIRGPGKSARIVTPIDSVSESLPFKLRVRKWFTDIETVKRMYTALSLTQSVQNEEEILVGFYESELEYGNIVENSERVKIRQRALGPDMVTFTDSSWQNLLNDDILTGTVVVNDIDETIEWTEGVDYEIDYTSGRIRRLIIPGQEGSAEGTSVGTGSSIESLPLSITIQKSVKIRYEYFRLKVKDIDYSINYVRGSIARKQGGTLVSGAKVYIDYKISDLVQNEVISLSIDQAHVWIINRIGSSYEGSVNENLSYGEAYLALHLISKMSAANLIYEKRNDDIEEAAKELKLISEDYRRLALEYLKEFLIHPENRVGAVVGKNIS